VFEVVEHEGGEEVIVLLRDIKKMMRNMNVLVMSF